MTKNTQGRKYRNNLTRLRTTQKKKQNNKLLGRAITAAEEQPVIQSSSEGQSSAVGQPVIQSSAEGQSSAVGQPVIQSSAVGQPVIQSSAEGQSSAVGQPIIQGLVEENNSAEPAPPYTSKTVSAPPYTSKTVSASAFASASDTASAFDTESASAFAPASTLKTDTENVNADKVRVKKTKMVIGLARMEGCRYCMKLKNKWKKFIKEIDKKDIKKVDILIFEAFDPQFNKNIERVNRLIKNGEKLNVNSFPTIFKIKDGILTIYHGALRTEDLKKFFFDDK